MLNRYVPTIIQTSISPAIIIGGGVEGDKGQFGMRQIQACVNSHGMNFRQERTNERIKLILPPFASVTINPIFRLPHVACQDECSKKVKYKITGNTKIIKALSSLMFGLANSSRNILFSGPDPSPTPTTTSKIM